MLCTRCLEEGRPKTITRGSFAIEVVLWLCFLVPGLIYTIWRLTTKAAVCRACGSVDLVPADSERARRLKA